MSEQYVPPESTLSAREVELRRASLVENCFGKPELALGELEVIETFYSDAELVKLPELRARLDFLKEEEIVKDLVESHRFRSLTPLVRSRYFGELPDFARWSALEYWTAEEAVLLTMELEPRADLLSEMQTVIASLTHDPSLRAQRACEALKQARLMEKGIAAMGSVPPVLAGCYVDSAVVLRDYVLADAAAEYVQLKERIKRAIHTAKLNERIAPTEFVTWAKVNGIPMPEELARPVEARNEIPDLKALLESNQALKREVDQLRAIQETNPKEDEKLNPKRERS
jgi:hypothetical protein